jgi:hypothetical protein
MELHKYTEIINFLRKMDGRKKTFLEDYACSIEELIAINILLELKKNPNIFDNKKDMLDMLKTKGALKFKENNNIAY